MIFRHALRNALIPLVTVVALDLPQLLGGTVIIEPIFAWPGMGTLAITAVRGRDYPMIMAINLIGAVMILVSNLLADVIYAGDRSAHQILLTGARARHESAWRISQAVRAAAPATAARAGERETLAAGRAGRCQARAARASGGASGGTGWR